MTTEDHRKEFELEEARQAGLAPAELDDAKFDESKQIDFGKFENPVRITGGGGGGSIGIVRNLRIREETATYLLNLDVNNQDGGESVVSDDENEDEDDDVLKVDEAKIDESKQMDIAKIEKPVRTTGGGGSIGIVRNLRIREETAKYLLNLEVNSAHYDPKTRSICEDPRPNAYPNHDEYKDEDDGDFKVDESKQMDFAKVEKPARTTGGGGRIGTDRNLLIREDTAQYLPNLHISSAHYDPKTRSIHSWETDTHDIPRFGFDQKKLEESLKEDK